MTKKNMKTLSKKSSSSSIDSGELPSKKSSSSSIDSGELAAENPLYDVTTDDFGSKFTELVTSLAHNQKTPSKKSSSSSTDSKYSGEPAADDSIYGVNTNDFDSKFMALYRTNSNSVIIEAKNMATFEENYLLTTDSKRRRFRIGKLRMGVVSKELNRNIDPTIDDEKIWYHFNTFQKACYYSLREVTENGGTAKNGGAATNGGALEARGGVVEDSRPPRPPPVRTQLNAPIASAPRPQPSAPIVAETPMLPVPPAPLPAFGNQAQMDAMMSTLQAQSEILRRTQEQQATTMTSMAFLADTLKALNENTRVQVQINEDEGDLDSCD